MKENVKNSAYYEDYEIDLGVLLRALNENKKFILIFTFIFSLIVSLYYVYRPEITPIYQSRIYFLAPSQLNVTKLNNMLQINETEKTLYNKFLSKSMSVDFHKKIFQKGNYGELLNSQYEPSIDFDLRGDEFISSVKTLSSEIIMISKYGSYEVTWNISMTGENADLISNFLNDLAKYADFEVLSELKKVSELKIKNRLNSIKIEKAEIAEMTLSNPMSETTINKLLDLNIEEEKLNSIKIDLNGIKSVHIDQAAVPAKNALNTNQKRRSLELGFQIAAGFLLSIFIVYIRKIFSFETKKIS
jgi:hypothetical protein